MSSAPILVAGFMLVWSHWFCLDNTAVQHVKREHEPMLSRQASASSLKRSGAAKSICEESGSSLAKRCEHVEVTFSG